MKSEYDLVIQRAVDTYLPDYDWRLFKAQLYQESKLNPNAVSPAGAGGLAQFMPATWKEMAPKAGYPEASRFDPEASIMTGAYYMSRLIEEWNWPRPSVDRHCLAMASYNAGLGNILKAQKLANDATLYAEIIRKLEEVTSDNSSETRTYVKRILSYCNDIITEG